MARNLVKCILYLFKSFPITDTCVQLSDIKQCSIGEQPSMENFTLSDVSEGFVDTIN